MTAARVEAQAANVVLASSSRAARVEAQAANVVLASSSRAARVEAQSVAVIVQTNISMVTVMSGRRGMKRSELKPSRRVVRSLTTKAWKE